MLIGKEALMIGGDKLTGGKSGYIVAEEFDNGYGDGYKAVGYKRSVAGTLVGDEDFIDSIGSVDLSGVNSSVFLYGSFFAGKPEIDGFIANVYQIDFDSEFLSGRYFLVPEMSLTKNSNGALTGITYPGDHYIIVSDIPDEIIVKNKNDEVLGSHKISFPQKKFIINNLLGTFSYNFYKKGEIVPGCYDGIIGKADIELDMKLEIGKKYDFTVVVQDVVGGG